MFVGPILIHMYVTWFSNSRLSVCLDHCSKNSAVWNFFSGIEKVSQNTSLPFLLLFFLNRGSPSSKSPYWLNQMSLYRFFCSHYSRLVKKIILICWFGAQETLFRRRLKQLCCLRFLWKFDASVKLKQSV